MKEMIHIMSVVRRKGKAVQLGQLGKMELEVILLSLQSDHQRHKMTHYLVTFMSRICQPIEKRLSCANFVSYMRIDGLSLNHTDVSPVRFVRWVSGEY